MTGPHAARSHDREIPPGRPHGIGDAAPHDRCLMNSVDPCLKQAAARDSAHQRRIGGKRRTAAPRGQRAGQARSVRIDQTDPLGIDPTVRRGGKRGERERAPIRRPARHPRKVTLKAIRADATYKPGVRINQQQAPTCERLHDQQTIATRKGGRGRRGQDPKCHHDPAGKCHAPHTKSYNAPPTR